MFIQSLQNTGLIIDYTTSFFRPDDTVHIPQTVKKLNHEYQKSKEEKDHRNSE